MKANTKITPKKLADYCDGRTCQSECKYNHLCFSVFGLDNAKDAYDCGRYSDEYKKLKILLAMINNGIPNDINKINELRNM